MFINERAIVLSEKASCGSRVEDLKTETMEDKGWGGPHRWSFLCHYVIRSGLTSASGHGWCAGATLDHALPSHSLFFR